MPTTPSPIDPLPTPPSSTDPANFDPEGDAFLSALPTMATQMNAAATVTHANAVEAAASATTANAARDAAIEVANAAMWSAATNYPTGTAAISPVNYRTYIRKSPGGVNATDPSAAPTLWEIQNPTRVTAGVIEHWNGTEYVPHGWKEIQTLATTSGASVLFSALPAWMKEFRLVFRGVSLNGTAALRIRLGTSGGLVTAGYTGARQYVNMASATSGAAVTDGFGVVMGAATVIAHGDLSGIGYGNVWGVSGSLADTASPGMMPVGGTVDLAALLTQIEVAAVTGNFDAGSVLLLGRA